MRSKQKMTILFSMALVLCVFLSSIRIVPVHAETSSAPQKDEFSQEYYRVMEEYYEEVKEKALEGKTLEEYQEQTVRKLSALGYEAYAVSATNYDEVQSCLKTNLKAVNIEEGDLCIIIVSGEDISRGAGSSFSYTYNGTTYTLRTLTVTAADNSAYGDSNSVNVLSSKVKSVIQSCLNAAITTLAGSINSGLGTVATICGLVIDNFSYTQTSTMYLNCGTNWTRAYTQVYDSFYNEWYSGSCTEYVRQYSYMSGVYYSASTNGYVAVPTNESTVYTYASYYTNTTWKRDHAVLGYLNSYVYYDLTGSVYYYYSVYCSPQNS